MPEKKKVDPDKAAEIYIESMKIIRKAARTGQNKGDVTTLLEKKIKEIVDDED